MPTKVRIASFNVHPLTVSQRNELLRHFAVVSVVGDSSDSGDLMPSVRGLLLVNPLRTPVGALPPV